MSAQEVARLLRRVDILEPLSAEEVEKRSGRIPEVRAQEGRLFYTPSLTIGVMFVLLEGRVHVYKMVEERELTLDLRYPPGTARPILQMGANRVRTQEETSPRTATSALLEQT